MFKALGKNPTGIILQKIKRSLRYSKEEFHNIDKTEVTPKEMSGMDMLKEYFNKPKDVAPQKDIPTIKTDLTQLTGIVPEIVWFGHSSYLITFSGKRILVDPVFENGSPVPFLIKPYRGTAVYHADDIPDIDVLIITHDHYDHLEYKTMMKMKHKIHSIVCSLGVSSHLTYWGFDEKIITELDWYEDTTRGNINITALPSRHFSGRTLKRNRTLWNAYMLTLGQYKLFLGGDSGYSAEFKKIGEVYGPFDLAFIECGQYNKGWPDIHMFPEQTEHAAEDLNTKVLFPIHWSKFTLSVHSWNEPIKRVMKAGEGKTLKIVSPKIGEVYTLGSDFKQEEWWNI